MPMSCKQKAYQNHNIRRANKSFKMWQSASKLTTMTNNNIKVKGDMQIDKLVKLDHTGL
jgi:hypothetical protein